ncbi:hypothetical protein HYY27_06955, partial [bacterium]|nr:hypothetical protein [bacterium]
MIGLDFDGEMAYYFSEPLEEQKEPAIRTYRRAAVPLLIVLTAGMAAAQDSLRVGAEADFRTVLSGLFGTV